MWREPEETWTLNAIFPPPTIVKLQHPSVQPQTQPNKYRKRDIYKTPHPRQPSNSDMRTDGCCVCATCMRTDWHCPAYTFSVCVLIEDREGVHACLRAHHTSLKTNSDWQDGIVHQVQQTCDLQSPAKGNEKAVQAFTTASSSLLNLWLEIF